MPTVSQNRPSAVRLAQNLTGSRRERTGSQNLPSRVLKLQPSPPGPRVALNSRAALDQRYQGVLFNRLFHFFWSQPPALRQIRLVGHRAVNQLAPFRSTSDRGRGHQSQLGLSPDTGERRGSIDHKAKLHAAPAQPTRSTVYSRSKLRASAVTASITPASSSPSSG